MPELPIDQLPVAAATAWLFPGQGAQEVGMGRDLYEQVPAARAIFDAADEALDFAISRICFDGPEDVLTRTENTQPALVTHSLAALAAAIELGSVTTRPAFLAGNSLGEYAAMIVAGAVSFEDGLRLVRERGRLMQEACDAAPSTMSAIVGLDGDVVAEIASAHGASICNMNAPGNISIGGSPEAVRAAGAAAEEAGARRVVPLTVAGAFHTPFMESAGDGLRGVLSAVTFTDPHTPVVSNVTAAPLTAGAEFARELTEQVTSPVLWERSVRTMIDGGVNCFVEFGPGRVLTGLVRRIERSAETRNVATAADAAGDGE